jgi:hypothetical protein
VRAGAGADKSTISTGELKLSSALNIDTASLFAGAGAVRACGAAAQRRQRRLHQLRPNSRARWHLVCAVVCQNWIMLHLFEIIPMSQ